MPSLHTKFGRRRRENCCTHEELRRELVSQQANMSSKTGVHRVHVGATQPHNLVNREEQPKISLSDSAADIPPPRATRSPVGDDIGLSVGGCYHGLSGG